MFCCPTPLPYQVPGRLMSCWVSACYACWFHARNVIEYLWFALCLCLGQSKIRQASSGRVIFEWSKWSFFLLKYLLNPEGAAKAQSVVSLTCRLNNPVSVAPCKWYVADRYWIELPCLSIDHNQFGRSEITVHFTDIFCYHSTITTLFHTHLLT